MSGVPYLGCKLSLVSKSENRYEGILYTVDTKESTVALAKVQCFGTERRPTERPVAPRDEIYEYIIFRAGDIKDLHVCEPPKPQPVTTSGLPNDPAILQHSAPQAACGVQYGQTIGQVCGMPLTYPTVPQTLFSSHSSGSRSASSLLAQKKAHTSDAGVQVPPNLSTIEEEGSQKSNSEDFSRQGSRDNQSRPMTPSQRGGSANRRFQRGRGGRRGRGRGRGGAPKTSEVLKFDGEYDFELANAAFLELETKIAKNETKDDSGTETLTGGDTEDDGTSYDRQKSFFDNISCEASLVAKGIARFDWRTERKLNVETFGVTYNNNWMRRRRGRGRFRRGGRGRGALAPNRTGTDTPKAVTFGDQLVTEVEIERPETPAAEISKAEDIPIIELVVPKEVKWEESATATKEEWN